MLCVIHSYMPLAKKSYVNLSKYTAVLLLSFLMLAFGISMTFIIGRLDERDGGAVEKKINQIMSLRQESRKEEAALCRMVLPLLWSRNG
jgi:hypothetical protein